MKRYLLLTLSLMLMLFIFVSCDTPTPELSITVELQNETKVIKANSNGEYTLDIPTRAGYEFAGWQTPDGKDFPASGKITNGTAVSPKWNILSTSTFEQLKERIEAGADTILLTENIVLTDTVYVASDTTITSDKSVTLTRDEGFLGDLFVIGETANGENVIVLNNKTASLSLKAENATLTVDGGNIAANGTAFLILNSSTLNIYDGVHIQNFNKTGNARLSEEKAYNVSYPTKVGGSAAIITSGAFNMYGGVISNCNASTDDALSSCGGAIYNYATFTMYGGTIENCTASRGSAIYNYRTVKIYAGTLKDNYATVYGGVMYMPNSQYTGCVIGSAGTEFAVKIIGNSAKKSGGAIFASHQSAINILGSTLFDSNTSSSNGGAINVAGALTVDYAVFTNNSATGKGGAIYAYYGDREYSIRIVNIKSGVFSQNTAPRGGAIAFSGNDDEEGRFETDPVEGAIGYIGNVLFLNNLAYKNSSNKYGNGGALWAALESSVSVSSEAVFLGNQAEDGNSHDKYETSDAKITVASDNT